MPLIPWLVKMDKLAKKTNRMTDSHLMMIALAIFLLIADLISRQLNSPSRVVEEPVNMQRPRKMSGQSMRFPLPLPVSVGECDKAAGVANSLK